MIKGKYITLRVAKAEERELIYEMALSTNYMKQRFEIDFPNGLESFEADYYEIFFDNRAPSVCGGMIIYLEEAPIGFISYCSICFDKIYLNPGIVEVDIWMNGEKSCGKGLGCDAIVTLTDYLHNELDIHTFIICPEIINLRAVRAYEKAGFSQVEEKEKQSIIKELFVSDALTSFASELAPIYLSPEYIFMIKKYQNLST